MTPRTEHRPILGFLRWASNRTLVGVVALGCMAPSMAINAVHQFTHTPGLMAYPLAAASVLSVLVAGCAPFAMRRAREEGNASLRRYAAAAFVICVLYNLSSAIGAASMARSDVAGARKTNGAHEAQLQKQLAEAEAERARRAKTAREQTPAEVEAAIALLTREHEQAWRRSKQCVEATRDESLQLCASHAAKKAELDAAKKVEALDLRIDELRRQLLSAPSASSDEPADPQAANIANALGLIGVGAETATVGTILNLLFAVAIEAIGALGPVVLEGVWGVRQNEPAAPLAQPDAGAILAVEDRSANQSWTTGGPLVRTSKKTGPRSGPRTAKKAVRKGARTTSRTTGPDSERTSQNDSQNNVLPFEKSTGPEAVQEAVQGVVQQADQDVDQEVVRMNQEGMSERSIAQALGISKSAVHRQLQAHRETQPASIPAE